MAFPRNLEIGRVWWDLGRLVEKRDRERLTERLFPQAWTVGSNEHIVHTFSGEMRQLNKVAERKWSRCAMEGTGERH